MCHFIIVSFYQQNNADKSVKNWSEEDNKEITGKGGELWELAFNKEGSSSLSATRHNGSAFWKIDTNYSSYTTMAFMLKVFQTNTNIKIAINQTENPHFILRIGQHNFF